MKIISVRQPWAYGFFAWGKDIENRVWGSTHRGEVAIHASSWWSHRQVVEALETIADHIGMITAKPSPDLLDNLRSQCGHIIGTVHMDGSTNRSDSPWFFGPKGLRFSDARSLKTPIPLKAQLGLYEAPDAITAEIERQRTAA